MLLVLSPAWKATARPASTSRGAAVHGADEGPDRAVSRGVACEPVPDPLEAQGIGVVPGRSFGGVEAIRAAGCPPSLVPDGLARHVVDHSVAAPAGAVLARHDAELAPVAGIIRRREVPHGDAEGDAEVAAPLLVNEVELETATTSPAKHKRCGFIGEDLLSSLTNGRDLPPPRRDSVTWGCSSATRIMCQERTAGAGPRAGTAPGFARGGFPRAGEGFSFARPPESVGGRGNHSASFSTARRTEKQSSPEKTRWSVFPSELIHFAGKLDVSPGPTSQRSVKNAVVHGPHGSGAS